MKRKQRQEEDTSSWMNTYSDMVTLLLTFFVLMFSMSTVDAEKWENFVKAFINPGEDTAQVVVNVENQDGTALSPITNEGPGADTKDSISTTEEGLPEDFTDLYRYLAAYTEENNLESSIELHDGKEVVYIRFKNNIFFDADSSVIRTASYPILDTLGEALHNIEDEIWIININGHTASVPNVENYKVSDWMLSSERASAIAIYFEEKNGLEPKIMRLMGYGKNYPVAPNDTPENREKNRRVDMMIVSKDVQMAQDKTLAEQFGDLFDPNQFPTKGDVEDVMDPSNTEGDEETALDLPESKQPELESAGSGAEVSSESTPQE